MCRQLASTKSGVSRKLRTDQNVTATRKPKGMIKNRSCQSSGGVTQDRLKARRAADFELSEALMLRHRAGAAAAEFLAFEPSGGALLQATPIGISPAAGARGPQLPGRATSATGSQTLCQPTRQSAHF